MRVLTPTKLDIIQSHSKSKSSLEFEPNTSQRGFRRGPFVLQMNKIPKASNSFKLKLNRWPNFAYQESFQEEA